MADAKNTPAAKATNTSPKAPTAPTVTTPINTPPAPPAPASPTPATAVTPAEKPKKVRKEWTYHFDTAEAATAEAKSRDGGPRRPFTLEYQGTKYHVVAHNPEHAKSLIADKLGVTCDEIGKEPKAKKEMGVEGILAALNAMSDADKAAVQQALAGLKK